MPKLKQVKAGKDYPEFGISRGQLHYVWRLKTGPRSAKTLRQIEKPKRSQLTSSPFLQTLYDIEDRIAQISCGEDAETLASDLRDLGDSAAAALHNMPESLQQGSTGQTLAERDTACESAADELDEIGRQLVDWEDEGSVDAPQYGALLEDARNVSINL